MNTVREALHCLLGAEIPAEERERMQGSYNINLPDGATYRDALSIKARQNGWITTEEMEDE